MSRFEGDGKKPEVKFSRVLSEDMPCVPYRRRTGETKTVIHWGQRKLLMSEIEFLTEHASEVPKMLFLSFYSSDNNQSQWVIYAGAAPGTDRRPSAGASLRAASVYRRHASRGPARPARAIAGRRCGAALPRRL